MWLRRAGSMKSALCLCSLLSVLMLSPAVWAADKADKADKDKEEQMKADKVEKTEVKEMAKSQKAVSKTEKKAEKKAEKKTTESKTESKTDKDVKKDAGEMTAGDAESAAGKKMKTTGQMKSATEKTEKTDAGTAKEKKQEVKAKDAKDAKKEGSSEGASSSSCEQTISANDAMKFDTKELKIDGACKTFKLTLKHTGRLPITAMGHNLVIAEDSKMDEVIQAGIKAGAAKGYIPDSADVLVATKLLGGGESDTTMIEVAKLEGKSLSFFCLFPGHTTMMRGKVTVGKKDVKVSS